MATDTRHKNEPSGATHPGNKSTADEQRTAPPRRDEERSSFAPFTIMRRGLDEMERVFGAGLRGEWDQLRRGWHHAGDWSPAIEAFQRGNEFVIRAEAPGMSRQDLHVEVGDDTITIRGERKQDHREARDGVFWTERSYGSFARVIPLPPGAITDSAKASFNNGVLEVVIAAPSAETRRGRKLDISGSDEGKSS
jgi:HSP20 family protein